MTTKDEGATEGTATKDAKAAEAKDAKDAKDAEANRASEAKAEEKMLRGEVALDSPDSDLWPDGTPMQSRYGKPEDMVTAQYRDEPKPDKKAEHKAAEPARTDKPADKTDATKAPERPAEK